MALLARNTAYADGPWNQKPYGDWDRRDVRRILFHSPWVRHFARTKPALEFEVPDEGPSGMELRGYHSKESKQDGAETTEFYIRWVSSRTLRKASARRLALHEKLFSNATETNPPKALDEFEIAIAGPDMSVFDRVREATLKSKCYLWVSSKRKTTPSGVEFARSGTGKVRGVLFRFPRKTAEGEPLISTHDKKVWFIEYGGEVEIRVSFDLQAMFDGFGLDL
jgi:hypothetical protein